MRKCLSQGGINHPHLLAPAPQANLKCSLMLGKIRPILGQIRQALNTERIHHLANPFVKLMRATAEQNVTRPFGIVEVALDYRHVEQRSAIDIKLKAGWVQDLGLSILQMVTWCGSRQVPKAMALPQRPAGGCAGVG